MTTTFNILLIDPDSVLYDLVSECVADLNSISLSVVMNGDEGFQIMKAGSFHALITDYSLSDIYAPEFSHLLKTSGIMIPHIVLTAEEGEDKVIHALNEGIRYYVKITGKGYKKELAGRIKSLIDGEIAEDTAKKSEEHYRYIADHASNIMAIRTDDTYFYLNPAGLEYCGLSDPERFSECLLWNEDASHTRDGQVAAIRYLPAELHIPGKDAQQVRVAVIPVVYRREEADFIIICSPEKKIEKKSLPAEITEELLADITSKDEGIRKRASDMFARMGREAVQPLFEVMRSLCIDDMFVKMSVEQTIAETLGKLGDSAVDDLSDAAQFDPDWNIRSAAIDALATIGDRKALGIIAQALESDEDWNVRAGAAEALGKLGDPAAIPYLTAAAAEDSNDMVKMYAQEALSSL